MQDFCIYYFDVVGLLYLILESYFSAVCITYLGTLRSVMM